MKIKSFVAEYVGLSTALKTFCSVGLPYNPVIGNDHVKSESFIALWDTGAMGSVITKNVVEKLGLSPVGRATVYHANGITNVPVYLVSIHLPCHIEFPYIRVTEGVLDGVDVLVGMDIIAKGDFAITAPGGNTKFTFQVPPTHDIDFVKEHDKK